MIPMFVIWLALAILFAVMEAATLGLTSIWFALGALVAMTCALVGAPFWIQIVVFVVVSAAAVWLTRDLAEKQFNQKRQATNADRILGHQGQVLEAIDNSCAVGTVRVDGAIWTARSLNGTPIPAGAAVTIHSIEGVKVMVTPKE